VEGRDAKERRREAMVSCVVASRWEPTSLFVASGADALEVAAEDALLIRNKTLTCWFLAK
jgi:hypothetical protein